MKLLTAIVTAGTLYASGAIACDLDEYFDASYVQTQVETGAASEEQARAVQQAALQQRDRNMAEARQVFLTRFKFALLSEEPIVAQAAQSSQSSTEEKKTGAD
jgi:hypothetical protein